MNITNALISLLQPSRAARFDAARQIAFIPGCEKQPLATLLQAVRNAEALSGLSHGGADAHALERHAAGSARLPADKLLDTISRLKKRNFDTLDRLICNSADARPDSPHADQIRGCRRVIAATRQFRGNVGEAASALGKIHNLPVTVRRALT